jgi:hypothetical protein
MELLAVRLARAIVQLPTDEINPRGKAIIPDLTNALVERYGFLQYPQKAEDYDSEKGISFELGRWNDISIDMLKMFSNGFVVDTRSSTSDSLAFLEDALVWAADSFDLTFRPDMLNLKTILSEITFRSETALNALNPAFHRVNAMLSEAVAKITKQTLSYDVALLHLTFDQLTSKLTLAPFRVERLVETPYADNKYYSTAPVHTEDHFKLIEAFEAALKG